MKWTEEQLQAINLEGENIIVSAGAGSGKTAVLTARVERKLLSGIHINELLVLTFTNAAAAEMKERIRKTINKNEQLYEEANLLDSAFITTFDAFSLALVKKYHTRLNITNNIKITDEVVIDIKKEELLEEIFNENYLTPKKDFMNLINDFCLKEDTILKQYILNIYKKIELKYDKENYLNNYFDYIPTNKNIILDYLDLIKEKQNNIREIFKELVNYFDNDFIIKMEDNFHNLLNANTYSDFKNALNYETIKVPRGTEESGKILKSTIYKEADCIKELCLYKDLDEIEEEINSTIDNIKVILRILIELDKRLTDYKRNNNVFNFTDISRLAIKVVLENDDIKEELTNSFQEILIDEYQDTSDLQEYFISLIEKNNVYMVGDIKQSIYRFRNANPYIFKNKYDLYKEQPSIGKKIDLLNNFRSRKEVINSINLIFNKIMDDIIGGANYEEAHQLCFGNEIYLKEKNKDQNYDLEIINYNDKELNNLTKDEEEAFIIGYDIKEKINSKYQIFDKDSNSLRDINYKDIVILLDKSKNFDLYKKIFEYLNIPLSILKDESLLKDDDILVIRNLLRLLICIKEKRFDIEFKYTYTSIARSFLYKMDDNQIYNCFVNDNFINTDLYKKCLELTSSIDIMSISSYFDYILDSFDYEEKLLTVGNINSFRIRREYLYNLCKNYEELGYDIYDFVLYLNQIFDNKYDLSFNKKDNDSNCCRIMTIHKSKGLEFPICYYAGFSSKFNISELKERIIFNNKYGIVLPKVDNYYKDTIIKTIIKNQEKREEISEKIRLLYVALTRAKEKMIIVMPKLDDSRELNGKVPLFQKESYYSFRTVMNSVASILNHFIKESNIIGNKDYLKNNKDIDSIDINYKDIKVEELSIDYQEVESKHFSKESLHLISKEEQDLMDFGTKVHEILERIDFNNYNLDLYEIDDIMKDKINAFINSELIKEKKNCTFYKEYEFIYKEDNVLSHGIIDLLIEEDESLTIIDYKLKNIDDPNYDKQLNGYRNYIESITNKKVYCFLYSIINEEFREVKEHIK